jgi:hypothetical protein
VRLEQPLAHRIPIISLRIGALDSKIYTMSILFMQGPFKRGTGFIERTFFNLEKSQESKGRSEEFKNT